MSTVLFFSVAVLVLGGSILLVVPCRPLARLLGLGSVVAGVGAFAGFYSLWPIVLVTAIALLSFLGFFFFAGPTSDDGSKHAPGRERKMMAGVVAAGIGGILNGIIWNNPSWTGSRVPHDIASEPTMLPLFAVLIPAVLGLLMLSGRESDGRER